ncbi:MAG TPA: FG-GAP-like repeat-containing protein [Gemmatimonadaceae bacterium]|nr:FG-GAP-like repeat-containing protein [Gemmatimonadaceae bacterium]
MAHLTRRRRLLLTTAVGALLFVIGASIAALRWQRRVPAYRPGESVEGVTSELARALPADYPRVTFTDVTHAAGIDFKHFDDQRGSWLPEDMGSGAAWGDFDADGWVDLAVVNEVGSIDRSEADRARSRARTVVYHNNRDGTFSDVTAKAGIDFRGWGMAAAWADYDNDGNLDLLITAYGHNVLYRNNGNGTFTDVSAASGIGKPEGFWAGAAWGDYDRDGRLDLYVTGYVRFERKSKTTAVNGGYDVENPASINPLAFPGERNLLFHNEGNGRFSERAGPAGVTNTLGRSLAASWVDLDEDGWLDLYVANDVSQNALFKNLGNGTFRDIAEVARVGDYRSSMGIAVGDWNRDGTQDLFLTHWLAQGNALYDNHLRRRDQQDQGNRPPLVFSDDADRFGLGQVSLDYVGWATSFIDYDNDGNLDLFVVNGSTLQEREDPRQLVPMQSKLFWNRSVNEGFFDVSPVSGAYFRRTYVGRGAAFADYDNDGDIDVFIVNHNGPGVLLRNDGGNRNHWVQVELQGTRGDRLALGAELRVVASGVAQVRQIGAQSPYLSQNSLIETFGLGQTLTVDTIEVRWPGGERQIRTGVAANQRVQLIEGRTMSDGRQPNAAAVRGEQAAVPDRDRVRAFWSVFREATAQRIAGQTAAAAQTYARALQLNPDHEDALYYAGSMRLELGDFAGAAANWRHLVSVNPASARTHSQLGTLFQCLDPAAPFQLDSAEWHLRRAHELNMEETGPLLRLGEVALLRGDVSIARRHFAAVLATHPGNPAARFYSGYLGRGTDRVAGVEKFHEATRTAPAVPIPGASSEGDTKRGAAPLRRDGERCNQLRALAEDSLAVGHRDRLTAYNELDALLKVARARIH